MAFPTSQQVKALGIDVGVSCLNEGRNRWPKGCTVIVLELNEVGTVYVRGACGTTTYLKASDLYPI